MRSASMMEASAGVSPLVGRRRPFEPVVVWALRACAALTVLTTVGIIVSLAGETIGFFREVSPVEFFTGTRWAPAFEIAGTRFGVVPLLTGTLMVALIGVVVAVPVGLAIAIYASEYASDRARRILKPILEVLAGIPTVVLGFFALNFVTGVLLKTIIPGIETFNVLSAGIVVGIMLVPTVASLSEDALHAVPRDLREAAYGLGATRREVSTRVVVPAALSGITAAVILALARAIGETMIVTIAAGNQPLLSFNPLHAAQTITAFIVAVSLGDTPAGSIVYRTIFALGSTLFLLTLGLNWMTLRVAQRLKKAGR